MRQHTKHRFRVLAKPVDALPAAGIPTAAGAAAAAGCLLLAPGCGALRADAAILLVGGSEHADRRHDPILIAVSASCYTQSCALVYGHTSSLSVSSAGSGRMLDYPCKH